MMEGKGGVGLSCRNSAKAAAAFGLPAIIANEGLIAQQKGWWRSPTSSSILRTRQNTFIRTWMRTANGSTALIATRSPSPRINRRLSTVSGHCRSTTSITSSSPIQSSASRGHEEQGPQARCRWLAHHLCASQRAYRSHAARKLATFPERRVRTMPAMALKALLVGRAGLSRLQGRANSLLLGIEIEGVMSHLTSPARLLVAAKGQRRIEDVIAVDPDGA
jgi:hypothetical protein